MSQHAPMWVMSLSSPAMHVAWPLGSPSLHRHYRPLGLPSLRSHIKHRMPLRWTSHVHRELDDSSLIFARSEVRASWDFMLPYWHHAIDWTSFLQWFHLSWTEEASGYNQLPQPCYLEYTWHGIAFNTCVIKDHEQLDCWFIVFMWSFVNILSIGS